MTTAPLSLRHARFRWQATISSGTHRMLSASLFALGLALSASTVAAADCGTPLVEIYDEDVIQGPQPPKLIVMVNLANYAAQFAALTREKAEASLLASACSLAQQNLAFEGFAELELADVQYVVIANLDEYGEADLTSAARYGNFLFKRAEPLPALQSQSMPRDLLERLAKVAQQSPAN